MRDKNSYTYTTGEKVAGFLFVLSLCLAPLIANAWGVRMSNKGNQFLVLLAVVLVWILGYMLVRFVVGLWERLRKPLDGDRL